MEDLQRVSTTEARKTLSELVNRVGWGQEAIGLSVHGKTLAVMVSPERYQRLLELERRETKAR